MTALSGVAPSILSADFARLGAQVAEVMEAGATVIHVDVMDGHFVPPITMGPLVVSALAEQVKAAGGLLDVHLMIERPERHVADFAKAGADVITIHAEATPHVHYALQAIRAAGCRAGLAVCPATPASVMEEVAADLDLALCMTVNPGWGGQPFIESMLPKVTRLRELVGPDAVVEVDGGVDVTTAPRCAAAGAGLLVAGSAVFGTTDPGAAVREIARSVAQAR
jgi:ribulose-phosphate 3-epimerase